MVQKKLALVLGGGGAAGNAWLIGIVAGLAEAGVDLTAADLVIGTSAGANAAAQVRSGIPPAELLAAVLAPLPPRPAGAGRPPQSATVDPGLERLRALSATATSVEDLQRILGAYGLECDVNFGPEVAEQRRAVVAARLPSQDWPERPMVIVAINAHTGELVQFDRNSGVTLADAATAATALPGPGPTHGINGVRYISGGVRSADNADLAIGYANVVVLAPLSERTGPLPPGQFEGLHRPLGGELTSQVERLRAAGSRVVVIKPDPASREAMGVNQMDFSTRAPSAKAGYEQGKVEAAQIDFA